jgi:hypothetical protein
MPAQCFEGGVMLHCLLRVAVFSFFALAWFAAEDVRPAVAEDTTFRCGGEIVSVGDSRYTVQKLCGKPSRSESVAKEKKKEPKGSTSKSSSGKAQKWYYDRGYGDFLYVLTFDKDTLKKIDKSGRGR